jgi:acetyl-CoA acyltransferase
MRDAVIVDALRTPVGKRAGGLAGSHPADLSALVLSALEERNSLDPAVVDDVIWGVVAPVGDQAFNLARTAVLAAGWPEGVPGTTVDRQCGSSQQAVHFAAAGLISGQYDVAIAGGVESMSRVPIGSAAASATPGSSNMPFGPGFLERYGIAPNQGIGAEMLVQRWNLSRTQLDEFALESHARSARAWDEGRFASQVVAVTPDSGPTVDVDEGIRRGGTLERLAALAPAFQENGTITAANSSQISDGAAALLMTTSEVAQHMGWSPIARVHTAVVVGDDPVAMLTAPIPATKKALDRSGLSVDDIGVWEVNEAFASVPLAWLAETGVDPQRMNPNGGAIALGHPLGGSGARIMTSLIHHMVATDCRYGLQTMCEAGGLANATILELL